MKKPIFCIMSILALLASCFGKKSDKPVEKAHASEYVRFPASDVPEIKFEHVVLDTDFVMKSFFIVPDKKHVYVLAYKYYSSNNPDDPTRVKRTDLRLFSLDMKGAIVQRIDMPRVNDEWGSSFGMVGDEVWLFVGDNFIPIDTKSFTVGASIPVRHEQHFPTKQNVTLMTPGEQRDAYYPLMDAALKDAANVRFLTWPSGKYFAFVQGPAAKRAAWTPRDYTDEELAAIRKFNPLVVSVNPTAAALDGDRYHATDGAAKIEEVDLLDGGTELDYPNYKQRHIMQYELTLNNRPIHFSTANQKRQDLRIGYADNRYLTTADGAVWVRYMSWLYRIE
jgi:hypothetical protein